MPIVSLRKAASDCESYSIIRDTESFFDRLQSQQI